jgi:hypothetical protein
MEEVIIIIGLDNNVWQNTVTNSSLSLLLAHILQQLGVCLPLKSIHTRKTIRIVFFFRGRGVGRRRAITSTLVFFRITAQRDLCVPKLFPVHTAKKK